MKALTKLMEDLAHLESTDLQEEEEPPTEDELARDELYAEIEKAEKLEKAFEKEVFEPLDDAIADIEMAISEMKYLREHIPSNYTDATSIIIRHKAVTTMLNELFNRDEWIKMMHELSRMIEDIRDFKRGLDDD